MTLLGRVKHWPLRTSEIKVGTFVLFITSSWSETQVSVFTFDVRDKLICTYVNIDELINGELFEVVHPQPPLMKLV